MVSKVPLVSDDICMGALHAKISDEYSKCLKIDLILRKYPVTDAKEMLNTMSDEDLKVLIDGGIVKDRYDYVGLQRFLTHFAKIRAEWIRSLVEVAKQIITVDNNYIVLHCSGDIEEMSALCDVDIPTDMVSCVEEMSETRKK